MKKKKLIMMAGLLATLPLSNVFAQGADHSSVSSATTASLADTQLKNMDIGWVDPHGSPTTAAYTLLEYLKNAPSHGLNPSAYKTNSIAAALKSTVTAADRQKTEQLLTDALVHYVQDMTGPRVSPTVVGGDAAYWRKPWTKDEVLQKYASTGDMGKMLQALEPKGNYPLLKRELQRISHLSLSAKDTAGVSNAEKAAQLIVNMERLRWDKERTSHYIEVNIASQTLAGITTGKTLLNSKVIVGEDIHKTHELITRINGVRFNPTWYVPENTVVKYMVPELQKDPHFYDARKFYIYKDGKRIKPETVDWNAITPKQLKHITAIQLPGPDNSLGFLYVLMGNPYDQYLHYTSHPELFAEQERNFSSGCMRLEKPDEVSAFILSTNLETIQKYKKGHADRNVPVKEPLTFYSVYHSITIDAEGQPQYHHDVYGWDKKLFNALKKKNAVPAAFQQASVKTVVDTPKPPSI